MEINLQYSNGNGDNLIEVNWPIETPFFRLYAKIMWDKIVRVKILA